MTRSNTVNTLVNVNLNNDSDHFSDSDYDSDDDVEERKEFLNSDDMELIEAMAEFIANAKSLTSFDIYHKVFKDMTYSFSENMDEIILKKYNPSTEKKEIILKKKRTTFQMIDIFGFNQEGSSKYA